jgi:hypothetical protein
VLQRGRSGVVQTRREVGLGWALFTRRIVLPKTTTVDGSQYGPCVTNQSSDNPRNPGGRFGVAVTRGEALSDGDARCVLRVERCTPGSTAEG